MARWGRTDVLSIWRSTAAKPEQRSSHAVFDLDIEFAFRTVVVYGIGFLRTLLTADNGGLSRALHPGKSEWLLIRIIPVEYCRG